jgi:hypothetical protein
MNQRSKSFRVYHKSQGTPSIAWGLNLSQILEDDEMTDTMVSCGQDGRVHAYDSNKPQAPPIDFNERLDERNKSWALIQNAKANIYRCQLGIDEQAEFIAFGNTDGIVEVYQLCTLKLIYISNCQRQKITTLEWKRKQ